MGEDPWCEYQPEPGKKSKKSVCEVVWDEGAAERLKNVPVFLRSMVKKGVEQYARVKGLSRITPDIMEEMKKRVSAGGRNKNVE